MYFDVSCAILNIPIRIEQDIMDLTFSSRVGPLPRTLKLYCYS